MAHIVRPVTWRAVGKLLMFLRPRFSRECEVTGCATPKSADEDLSSTNSVDNAKSNALENSHGS